MHGELEGKTADGFSVLSSVQNSQSAGGMTDSCEGSQVYPPTPPIMLQVNCMCALYALCLTRLHSLLIRSSAQNMQQGKN